MAKLTITREASISPKLKSILFPVSLLMALFILSTFAYRILSERISEQSKKLSVARKNENILRDKQNLLTELSSETNFLRDISLLGVPDKDSELMLIGQIKNLASERLIVLSDLKVGASSRESTGLEARQVQFDLLGNFGEVLSFFLDLGNVSPLVTIEKADLNQSGGVVNGGVTLKVYTAPFPEKLPPLTEPLTDFTDAEREVLSTLSGLTPPSFLEVSPEAPTIRSNPFE